MRCLMPIAQVPNRNARPSVLLRETCREGGKVKNLTLWRIAGGPKRPEA